MPRNTFVAGEVLTAAEMNSVADQTVMTFAGTAARGSAIASPSEGMVSYLEDLNQVEVYAGTAIGWTSVGPAETPGDNLLYNGAMQVAQRGTSATGLGNGDSGYHTADRYRFAEAGTPTVEFTQTIESDGPTGSGFTKSLKMECTTADASPAATDLVLMEQRLEGQDLQGLKKGTANAESLTLSFWVKSNVTGTYIIWFLDTDNSRSISASYTVSSSGVWEKKTLTFDGDTSGPLDNDNGASLILRFGLLAGSDFSSGTLQTSWGATSNTDALAGQTNVAASTSNYWQVTGVQLEAGEVATPFEHKTFGVELAECQRYYVKAGAGNNKVVGSGYLAQDNVAEIFVPLNTFMRTSPTMTILDDIVYANGAYDQTATSYAVSGNASGGIQLTATVSATSGTFVRFHAAALRADGIFFDSEL